MKTNSSNNTVFIVEAAVDYAQNMKLTKKLEYLVCPV